MEPRRISLTEAFAAQGVALQDERHSWSGVRCEDGCVVIAIRDCDVRVSFDGFSCLLWAPRIACAGAGAQRSGDEERLEHCRLAELHGGAHGLLVSGALAQVERGSLLPLRVEKRRGEYWALWGSGARAARLAFDGSLRAAANAEACWA